MPPTFRLLLPPDSSVPDHLQVWQPFGNDLAQGPRGNLFLRVDRTDAAGRDRRADSSRPRLCCRPDHSRVWDQPRLHDRDPARRRRPGDSRTAAGAVRGRRHPVDDRVCERGEPAHRACGNPDAGDRAAARTRRQPHTAVAPVAGRRTPADAPRRGRRYAGGLRGIARARWARARVSEPHPRAADGHDRPRVHARHLGGVGRAVLPRADDRLFVPRCASFNALGGPGRSPSLRPLARRRSLVVVQVASSVVLLIGAGLLARAFVEVQQVDPGFRDRSTSDVSPRPSGQPLSTPPTPS